ncbi:DNA-binding CsgD family transcriptional regulator/GAF domain-containing protein [Nocardia kruczakiae]|uniref:DNA-binding CsgD family transcriptional regulator/GAF domain-containing protein n=1 Tax=Nocardia kruczakiae TaxID=261477 RepID=A0ABU1X8P8_9NOCA|nr:LuxR C-terminal-related transcriptional regulator [Nocardia kruczakiae]MDR7166910.1 DNA-binding CsgD family transcriptional regulator/GAF domain-containing protein [Nocardia kruczakiae]
MTTATTDSPRRDVALDRELGIRIRELVVDAGATLGREFPTYDYSWALTAKQILRYLWDATLADLVRATDARPDLPARLTALLARIREAESAVDEARLNEGVELLRRVRRALASLHDAVTVDDLFTRAPEAACTLGFDRVLLSTVENSVWKLSTMCVVGDPKLAEDMVATGRDNPPRLDGTLIESDIVAHGRAGLALDVQQNPRVERTLVKMSRCTSYAIAPLAVQGRVVGMVHGDCYQPHREVDSSDRAVLNLFAEGLSHNLARVRVLEGVADLQRGMQQLTGTMQITARPTLAAPVQPHPLLSSREVEVVGLLAAGEPNRLIARKLSISEGTVKTHVTHILRKLGAANRAEAVSYWLRDTPIRAH